MLVSSRTRKQLVFTGKIRALSPKASRCCAQVLSHVCLEHHSFQTQAHSDQMRMKLLFVWFYEITVVISVPTERETVLMYSRGTVQHHNITTKIPNHFSSGKSQHVYVPVTAMADGIMNVFRQLSAFLLWTWQWHQECLDVIDEFLKIWQISTWMKYHRNTMRDQIWHSHPGSVTSLVVSGNSSFLVHQVCYNGKLLV